MPATTTDRSDERHAEAAESVESHIGSPTPSLVVLHPGAPERHSQIRRFRSSGRGCPEPSSERGREQESVRRRSAALAREHFVWLPGWLPPDPRTLYLQDPQRPQGHSLTVQPRDRQTVGDLSESTSLARSTRLITIQPTPHRRPNPSAIITQMRCRECAAEVAVTARVCPRCGAAIVGQSPVVAEMVVGAVSDTVVSDAVGKAVPAGVAEQALPEPYLPGSGDRVPAELRLVLAGYAGLACGLFAGALACATVFAFLFLWISLPSFSLPVADDIYIANDLQGMLFGLSFVALWCGAGAGAWVGAVKGVQALKARIRFSRLLRRPSDARTATVTASKRGGRTLILDTIPWRVPAPVRGPPRVVDEGRNAHAR